MLDILTYLCLFLNWTSYSFQKLRNVELLNCIYCHTTQFYTRFRNEYEDTSNQ